MNADNALLRRPVPLDRSHFPGQDDEEVAVPVSLPRTGCLPAACAALALRGQRGDLGITQPGIRPLQVGSFREILADLKGRLMLASAGFGALSDVGFVDIAPAPVLARLERLHDRVPDREGVGARVPQRGRIAAAHVPAGQAQPQVHPRGPQGQAFLAALRASAVSPVGPGSGADRSHRHARVLLCWAFPHARQGRWAAHHQTS